MKYLLKRLVSFTCAVYWLFTGAIESVIGGEDETGIQMNCADSTVIFHKIQINSGVQTEKASAIGPVAVISIPIMRNGDAYLGCLEMYGKNTEVAKIAYFQDWHRCRRQASSRPRVSISAKSDPVLMSGFDAGEFERCMHEKDRKLEVELIG